MKHYSEDELNNYIEKILKNQDEETNIKNHLEKCFDCFQKYIDLKEVKYFMQSGETMPDRVIDRIVNMVIKPKMPVLSLIIYYTKKTLRVFSEDNFQLKSQFIDVSYAMRSGKEIINNNDSFSLQKTIGDYNVIFKIFHLSHDKSFSVDIELKYKNKNAKNIRIFLKENEQELEFIDYPKTTKFSYEMKSGEYEFLFSKNVKSEKEYLFSINIKLKEED